LPTELIVAMANLPDRRPDARVFGFTNRNTVKNHWDQAVARAGIERLTPHCMRHGFATGLLQAGVDVVTVAKLGGWGSPAHVFETYGHASEDRTLTDRLTGGYGDKNGDRSASRRNQERSR
jgi:integrase